MNRDFYKAVFADKKKLLHVSEVKLKNDELLMPYLPDKWDAKKKLDREWFFNIVNSVHPGYLEQVIKHAQT